MDTVSEIFFEGFRKALQEISFFFIGYKKIQIFLFGLCKIMVYQTGLTNASSSKKIYKFRPRGCGNFLQHGKLLSSVMKFHCIIFNC